MNCCSASGLNDFFGRGTAEREAQDFRKKGLPKRARALVERLEAGGIEGASVLDIGFGVGAMHLELLRRGAARAIGVEIVRAYLEVAQELAAELNLRHVIDYRLADFVQAQQEIGPADIVVLDRSVCCYPDMPALVGSSATRAMRFYGLILPVEAWWTKLGVRLLNSLLWLLRRRFRVFIHPQLRIDAVVASSGLSKVMTSDSGIWRTHLYSRAAAT